VTSPEGVHVNGVEGIGERVEFEAVRIGVEGYGGRDGGEGDAFEGDAVGCDQFVEVCAVFMVGFFGDSLDDFGESHDVFHIGGRHVLSPEQRFRCRTEDTMMGEVAENKEEEEEPPRLALTVAHFCCVVFG